MRKLRIFIIIFGLISIGLVSLVFYYQSTSGENNRRDLRKRFDESINSYNLGKTTCLDIAKITPFTWDRLYFFRPYRTSDEIDKILGFEWDDVNKTVIGTYEGISLLVFMEGGKVVQYLEYPRGLADFAKLDNGMFFTPQQSCFIRDSNSYMILKG